MPLYAILLGVQYASIALMLFMCAYITKNQTQPLHYWLFFYCAATLFNNAGYLAVMRSHTLDEAILAVQLSYLGRSWIPFSLFYFVIKLCKKRRNPFVTPLLAFIHATVYVCMLSLRHNTLYYTSFQFVDEGLFPHIAHTNGIVHHILNIVILLYGAYGLALLFRTIKKQKNVHKRHQLIFVTGAIFTDLLFFVLECFHIIPGYDMTALGYTLSSIFLYIAVFRYDLLDTKELARDFVIEHVSDGIITTNKYGTVSFCNEKARKLFPELADFPDKTLADIQKLIAEGKTFTVQDRIYTLKENSLLSGTTTVGKVYVLSDDTEHFHYIADLKEQKQIADKANHAKGEFLSNMSHEIRSPINAVLGLDEMILRESSEKHIKGYAADIQSSGKMLLSVINDILDFSKIESGKMEIVPADYDLSCLVSDLVNMTAARAQAKGLSFTLDIDEHIPHQLYGDETRLKQCILNILTNAVKYTPEGSVTLTVNAEKIDDTHCSLFVSIKDTGIGIKEEDIKKLFSPFERIEEGRNRAIEGTGLGMSIVKNLLAAMGTQLAVESVYGKGSCFSFRVVQEVRDWEPIGDYAETKKKSREHAGAYTESFQAPDAKILVVDDTPVNLTVMQGLLKQTRIQIDTAEDGMTALGKTKAQKYDILFIDHRMPQMDGPAMLAALRSDSENVNRNTLCIALTANVTGDVCQQYRSMGFDDYLSKPVEPKLLEELLVRCLPAPLILHKGDSGWQEHSKPLATEADTASAGAAERFFASRFGIAFSAALKNCGDEEVFAQAVQGFYDDVDTKAADIERSAAAQDWQNYTVLVHSLKSSARLIGASELSEQAAALEALGDAAKLADSADAGNAAAAIREQTPALLCAYRAYKAKLAPLCTAGTRQDTNNALPLLTQAELDDRLSALCEFAEAFDFDGADTVMAELATHSLPPGFLPQYEGLKSAVRNADSAAILALLKNRKV